MAIYDSKEQDRKCALCVDAKRDKSMAPCVVCGEKKIYFRRAQG